MTRAPRHMTVDEFADDLAGILDRVAREGESIVVEREGNPIALVKPMAPANGRHRRRETTEDASAHSWPQPAVGGA